jgi:hypothetical protein
MQTYGNPDVTYGWWAGNAGVTNKSGKFIAAHIAHTGLIAFAAGGSTLWELARYNPEIPMGHQSSIFLAHLASIGIGFDEAGAWTGAGVASIAIVHLVLSMVYGAGGLLHSVLFVGDMQDSEVPQARKFKLEWDNPDNQTFILGHHLLFFGVACICFDKQEMTKMQKQIDKNQSTKEIEKRIILIKNILQHHLKREKEQNNYIVLIDNSDLHHKTIDKINEWLAILGESLKAIASKQLRQIVEQTNKYNKDLNAEMNSIELLKILLRVISDIKDISMDMEFKIVEVQEQFRVLKMYDYEIEPEIF